MSTGKLRVSVQEARHLFYSLRQDLRKICTEELAELEKDFNETPESDEFETVWAAVDHEFRNAYEMSRFGIELKDVAESTADIDVFRGYCEDIDGVEPRDESLLQSISRETQTIQDLLEYNALYRRSIPTKIEDHLNEHVARKRRLFASMQNVPKRSPPQKPVDSDLPPPELLNEAMQEVSQRLSKSILLLDTCKAGSLNTEESAGYV